METKPDPAPTPDSPTDGEKTWWLDDPQNVKLLLRIFFISCGVFILLDLLKYIPALKIKHHVPGKLEYIPGFFGIYGCLGCVALVLIAKQMRQVLMRPEDYYDR